MTTQTMGDPTGTVLDSIRGARDAMSVRRVFGDPYELDGATLIPVARVVGGAGGGGGEGTGGQETGSGFGTGFGLGAQPVGVYIVRDGNVEWKPTIDVSRIIKGAQVLTGLIAICATRIFLRRRR